MRHCYPAFLFAVYFFLTPFLGRSQTCADGRYRDSLFSVEVTRDVYFGSNINVDGDMVDMKMDIYEPANDTKSERPLVFVTHGGSFLGGDKGDACVSDFCRKLAQVGYVAVSQNYRIGMENFPFPGPDSTDATEAVWRATHDARAAVRFFRKDVVENGNTYGVDTSTIIYGGSSAGAFMALHLAYLDRPSEIPKDIDTTKPGMGGGMEGNSGNPGYSSEVDALIGMAGALGDTAWMEPGDEPVVMFHGDEDGTVPYDSDTIVLVGQYELMEVDGSESVHKSAQDLGMNSCFKPYPGQGHVPECNSEAYMDTSFTMTKNFLLQFACDANSICSYQTPALGIGNDPALAADMTISPNPADQRMEVVLPEQWKGEEVKLTFYDLTGRTVRSESLRGNGPRLEIERKGLPSGVYMMQVKRERQSAVKKVVFR